MGISDLIQATECSIKHSTLSFLPQFMLRHKERKKETNKNSAAMLWPKTCDKLLRRIRKRQESDIRREFLKMIPLERIRVMNSPSY